MVCQYIDEFHTLWFGSRSVDGDTEVGHYEIRLPPRPLKSEVGMGQSLESKSGNRPGWSDSLHLVIIHSRHLSADQQRVIRWWGELGSCP